MSKLRNMFSREVLVTGAAVSAALFVLITMFHFNLPKQDDFQPRKLEAKPQIIPDVLPPDSGEEVAKTTPPETPWQQDEIKNNIKEVMTLRSQGVNIHDLDDALQELAKYGDAVFEVISGELFKGNDEVMSKENINLRMSMIDFLGFAAKSNDAAKKVLMEFGTSDLDYSKPERVVHMDLADRLEAFSYVTKTDEASAIEFVRSLGENGLRREYIYTMFIGYRMGGMEQAEAMEKLYRTFRQ